jgi:hypothetical protein
LFQQQAEPFGLTQVRGLQNWAWGHGTAGAFLRVRIPIFRKVNPFELQQFLCAISFKSVLRMASAKRQLRRANRPAQNCPVAFDQGLRNLDEGRDRGGAKVGLFRRSSIIPRCETEMSLRTLSYPYKSPSAVPMLHGWGRRPRYSRLPTVFDKILVAHSDDALNDYGHRPSLAHQKWLPACSSYEVTDCVILQNIYRLIGPIFQLTLAGEQS